MQISINTVELKNLAIRLKGMKAQILFYLPFFMSNLFVTAFICWSDGTQRKISNRINKTVLFTNAVAALCYGFIWDSVPFAVGGFVILLLLWLLGVFGAGDVKLLSAFLVGIKPDLLFPALIMIGLLGGVQLVVMTIWYKSKKLPMFENGIPYGIPISLSCFVFATLSALSS
ncbi:A24 family peptidase [Vibrio sp. TRT 21S02]|uniref:A24 family peptidase n=1 Tax=Vibrio sp. TRT 21S02 TaxID=3418507 RepID=UPI003CF7ACFC